MGSSKNLDISKYLQQSADSAVISLNGNCPLSRNEKLAERVRQSVADLNSLLGLVVTMRNGLDDMPPRTYEEISILLESSVPQQIRKEIADKFCASQDNFIITPDIIQRLETEGYRLLTGRR